MTTVPTCGTNTTHQSAIRERTMRPLERIVRNFLDSGKAEADLADRFNGVSIDACTACEVATDGLLRRGGVTAAITKCEQRIADDWSDYRNLQRPNGGCTMTAAMSAIATKAGERRRLLNRWKDFIALQRGIRTGRGLSFAVVGDDVIAWTRLGAGAHSRKGWCLVTKGEIRSRHDTLMLATAMHHSYGGLVAVHVYLGKEGCNQ